MKIALIGAKTAGLTVAYLLSKVDVYDASHSVGGLAKTISLRE
jgi:predicted NAD/FAD-binding protein